MRGVLRGLWARLILGVPWGLVLSGIVTAASLAMLAAVVADGHAKMRALERIADRLNPASQPGVREIDMGRVRLLIDKDHELCTALAEGELVVLSSQDCLWLLLRYGNEADDE